MRKRPTTNLLHVIPFGTEPRSTCQKENRMGFFSLVALFGFAGCVMAVPHNSGSVDAVEALVARVLGPAAQHHFSFSVVDGGCEGSAPPCYTIAGPCGNHACIPFCFVRKLSTVSSRRRKRRHTQNLWVICLRADGGRGALSSTVLQHDDWLATRRGESHLCAVSMAGGRWHRRTTSEQRVELHHERMHAQVVDDGHPRDTLRDERVG